MLVPVVVADRGDHTRIGGESDSRERPALAFETPDELGDQMLCVRGAASVAKREHLPAGHDGTTDGIRGRGDAFHPA